MQEAVQGTTTPTAANVSSEIPTEAVPPIRAANLKLDQMRRDEKDLVKSIHGCSPLGKAVLQEKLNEVREQIKAELGARTELLPGARQVRIALNALQHREEADQRAEKKLAAHKVQMERMQKELAELEAKVVTTKAAVSEARANLTKAEAVVAEERATASADMAVEADYTVGDETTRCEPQQDEPAITLSAVQNIMLHAAKTLGDGSADTGQALLRFLEQGFMANASTMRRIREQEDTTPATQPDLSQET